MKRPWVSVNFATTWDGRIAANREHGATFSSQRDKHRLLEIRALADAVMVSAQTVSADRMSMGLPDAALRAQRRQRGQQEYPMRVVLSQSGRLSPDLPLFQKAFSTVVVCSTEKMSARTRKALAERTQLRLQPGEKLHLPEVLRMLQAEYGVERLHCEGGGSILRALLAEDLVDEIYLTLCPRIFGGEKAPTLTGAAGAFLPKSVAVALHEMEVHEGECFLQYLVQR